MLNHISGLVLMVFLLGIKHGIDPDHLVAIDGMTRFNASSRPRLSRWVGFLFSLGHGLVVVGFATFLGAAATQHHVPQWTETVGALTSVVILLALGSANLYGALRATSAAPYKPIGFKGTLLARFFKVRSPFAIVLVGILFATSFDTLSQAALFAATTTQANSWHYAAALALCFTGGMMLPDAANGLWLSKLLRQANSRTQLLSRLMGGIIAGLSLAIGSMNLTRLISPAFAARVDAWQLLISTALILLAVIGFPALLYVWRHRAAPQPATSAADDAFTQRQASVGQQID